MLTIYLLLMIADAHHHSYKLKTIMKGWKQQSYHSHTVLYSRIQYLSLLRKKKEVVEIWISRLAYQKLLSLKTDQIANEKNATNTLKWFMRRWIAVAKEIKMERLSENKVLKKWDEVRKWLHDPCIEERQT
jgi:hypothetical protein